MSRLIPIQLDNYKPLRELVFESLREAIIQGVLKPGERLMEIQLAEEIGVSRTPIREAIRKLELDGFVVMVPRKGAFVAGISMKDIIEVFEVRTALEGLAASLAADRITDEEMDELERSLAVYAEECAKTDLDGIVSSDAHFHELIYQASRNERLSQIIVHLKEQIQRFRKTSLSQPGRSKDAVEEHRRIVEAIGMRDSELAMTMAREHIEAAEQILLNSLQEEF